MPGFSVNRLQNAFLDVAQVRGIAMPYSWDDGIFTTIKPNQSQIRRDIRDAKRLEKPSILEFLTKGVTAQRNVSAMASSRYKHLQLVGASIEGMELIFILREDGVIVANQNRTNQVRKELEAFAALQGYTLEFVRDMVHRAHYDKTVFLQKWPKRQEVDDSDLLVTRVQEPHLINSVDDESGEDEDYCCEECARAPF